MMGFRRGCPVAVMLAFVLAGPAVAQTAGAASGQEVLIARLGALFEVNHVQAFAQTEAAFRRAAQADDLDLMVALLKLVGPETVKHECQILMDRLCPVAAELAAAKGRWREQGDALLCQATCRLNRTVSLMDLPLYPWDRRIYIARRALAAYAKAGVDPPEPREWFARWPGNTLLIPSAKLQKEVYDWPRVLKEVMAASSDANNIRGQIEALPQPYRDRVKAVAAANADGRETDAVAMAIRIAEDALADPDLDDFTRCEPIRLLAGQAAQPGGEALAPLVRKTLARVQQAPGFAGYCGDMSRYCMYLSWSVVYPTDPGLSESCWLFRRALAVNGLPDMDMVWPILDRLTDLGLYGELAAVVDDLVTALPAANQTMRDQWGQMAFTRARLHVPAALRELLLTTSARHAATTGDAQAIINSFNRGVPTEADIASFAEWCAKDRTVRPYYMRIAQWLLEIAWRTPNEDQRARLAEEAANFYLRLGQPQRAEAAHRLMAELIAGKPDAIFKFSLSIAQSAAAGGQWDAAVAVLQPAVAAAPESSPDLLEAAMLLTEAHLRLGRPSDAEPWLTKAKSLIGTVSLSSAEKASYLMTLAELCDPRGSTD